MHGGKSVVPATRNFATSYISLAPIIPVTAISLPAASIITARAAPLNGVKLLMASPLLPVKKPLLLAINDPSAAKVFSVNTDLLAFFVQLGWAAAGETYK